MALIHSLGLVWKSPRREAGGVREYESGQNLEGTYVGVHETLRSQRSREGWAMDPTDLGQGTCFSGKGSYFSFGISSVDSIDMIWEVLKFNF